MSNIQTSGVYKNVQDEIRLLRSFVIGLAGKDKEGSYKPSFIKKVLKAAKEKPEHTFQDEVTFLEKLG